MSSPARAVYAGHHDERGTLSALGRVVFGLGVLGFGIAGLLFGDFLRSLQPVPQAVPGYAPLAAINALILGAAGLAIPLDHRAREAAALVIVVLAGGILFLHVPSAFTQPALLRSPWWIRTFESTALIGGAIVLAGVRSAPPRDTWMRTGRIALGLSLPIFGVLHLVYLEGTATLVPPWYPWPLFWAFVTGLAQIIGDWQSRRTSEHVSRRSWPGSCMHRGP
jgi:uncharacterized membrane protein